MFNFVYSSVYSLMSLFVTHYFFYTCLALIENLCICVSNRYLAIQLAGHTFISYWHVDLILLRAISDQQFLWYFLKHIKCGKWLCMNYDAGQL